MERVIHSVSCRLHFFTMCLTKVRYSVVWAVVLGPLPRMPYLTANSPCHVVYTLCTMPADTLQVKLTQHILNRRIQVVRGVTRILFYTPYLVRYT